MTGNKLKGSGRMHQSYATSRRRTFVVQTPPQRTTGKHRAWLLRLLDPSKLAEKTPAEKINMLRADLRFLRQKTWAPQALHLPKWPGVCGQV